MATQDLMNQKQSVDTSLDNVIIVKIHDTVPGGRTLDTSGIADAVLRAGHPVFRHNDTGEYVPMPLDGSIPLDGDATTEAEAVGLLVNSIATDKPEAAIMTRGVADEAQMAYAISDAIKTKLTDRISFLFND